MNAFYDTVRGDDVLGPIFDGVAAIDWRTHLPKMYDFWEGVLFGGSAYHGNPLAVHAALSQRVALGPAEFGRWLTLFRRTVDELFAGPIATDTKLRAKRIAAVLQQRSAAPRDADAEADSDVRRADARGPSADPAARLPVRAVPSA